MMIRTLLVVILAAAPAFAAGVILEPVSYTKPIPGTAFLFVMLGDPAVEAGQKDAETAAKFAEIRAKYPQTGLYHTDSGALVWAVDTEGYTHPDWVFLTADGVHLVRIDGDSWRTKDYSGRNRLPAEDEQKQLDAPAVSFFKNGKLIKRYALRALVTDPGELPHSPQHILWVAGAVLNTDETRFVAFTQDSNQLTFDVATGELLAKEPAGLGNPRLVILLSVIGGLMAAMLIGWLVFLLRQRKAAAAIT